MRTGRIMVVASVSMALTASLVLADAEAARQYVKEAAGQLESNDMDSAGAKLDLAEAELDGVPESDKAAIAAQIKAYRGKIAAVKGAAGKAEYQRKLDSAMKEAEESIGNLATWPGAATEVNELLSDDAAKAALGDEAISAAAKKFATFKKLNARKAGPQLAAEMDSQVKSLESDWAEAKATINNADSSPNSKSSAIEDTERRLERIRKDLDAKGLDDDAKAPFVKRIDTVSEEFTKLALADKIKEVAETLKRKADTYQNEWEGWEAEAKGPSWADYKSESGEKMSAFLAPKTKALISRFDDYLKNLQDDSDYKTVASAPEIKKIIDDVKARRDKAYAKMLGFVKEVVDPALAAKVDDSSAWGRLKDDVRNALGEASEEGRALQDKIEKKVTGAEQAAAGADAAKGEMIKTLRSKADAAWPTLKEGLTGATDYDLPNQVGKTVTFTADNLMGYRFKPGDFYFATTLGGEPVVGKFDPALAKQIKETETAIGRSIGDDDGDGKWEVFAVVTDKKAKLLAKRQAEAQVEGTDIKVTGEYAEPVEATVLNIVAAKCGPFAGSVDKGVLKTDGTVGK